jgi:hypothetical protein
VIPFFAFAPELRPLVDNWFDILGFGDRTLQWNRLTCRQRNRAFCGLVEELNPPGIPTPQGCLPLGRPHLARDSSLAVLQRVVDPVLGRDYHVKDATAVRCRRQ